MRILGVDPGSRATGWAILENDVEVAHGLGGLPRLRAAGVLRTRPEEDFADRLASLFSSMESLLQAQRPNFAAVERVFSGVNPQSLIALGEARGVILLALARSGIPSSELTPAEVKKSVTGSGVAEKEQVRRMLAAILPAPSRMKRMALDATDAAAVALAHWYAVAPRGARVLGKSAPRAPGELDGTSSSDVRWRRRTAG